MNNAIGLKKSLINLVGHRDLYSIDGISDTELLKWISTPNVRMSAEKEEKVLKYIKSHDDEIYSPPKTICHAIDLSKLNLFF